MQKATLDDLYAVDGKAELVNGQLVCEPPTGGAPSNASFEIAVSLRAYAKREKVGHAVSDNAGFRVDLPHRQSFSPDAAFFTDVLPGMKFFEGAPVFAVEVRSEGDYGIPAEKRIREKRRDYFAAGTKVVWDVDLLSDDVVRVYRVETPDVPTIYRRGDVAEAEPAVPKWRMPVDDLFL